MKRLAFAITGVALFALGACSGSNQDAVNNAELNQPAADDLNGLANEAASNADQALGNQQLNDQNAAAESNGSNPSEAEEQNVSGM